MMIDTIMLYILVLVKLPLTLIQGHRSAREQILLRQVISKSLQSMWVEFAVS